MRFICLRPICSAAEVGTPSLVCFVEKIRVRAKNPLSVRMHRHIRLVLQAAIAPEFRFCPFARSEFKSFFSPEPRKVFRAVSDEI